MEIGFTDAKIKKKKKIKGVGVLKIIATCSVLVRNDSAGKKNLNCLECKKNNVNLPKSLTNNSLR